MDDTRLTKDTIVAEAILLLDEAGLDGVSLRKLGARLGVKAPSLYWHFPDKSALLAAVLEKLFNQCLDAVPEHTDWQAWMRSFGAALWQRQITVRDFGRLVTTTDVDDAQMARTHARIKSRISSINLPEKEAMRLQSTVQALITGWSAFAAAPYAKTLGKTLPFESMAMHDLETILAGRKLEMKKPRRRKVL
jgi:TetR/AcrR family tetracycline transcriptional repressor